LWAYERERQGTLESVLFWCWRKIVEIKRKKKGPAIREQVERRQNRVRLLGEQVPNRHAKEERRPQKCRRKKRCQGEAKRDDERNGKKIEKPSKATSGDQGGKKKH